MKLKPLIQRWISWFLTDHQGNEMANEKAYNSNDFHLEEYKQLKTEVTSLLGRIDTLSRYCLVVAAGVFSWRAAQGVGAGAKERWCLKLPSELFTYAWYIPFAFSVLSGLAAFAAYWRGREMGEYLKSLELKLAHGGKGWEHYLAPKPPVLSVTGYAFWAVLLIATFYAGHEAAGFVNALSEICAASGK